MAYSTEMYRLLTSVFCFFVFCFHCYDKMTDKNNLRRFCLGFQLKKSVQYVMERKTEQWRFEASGNIVPTVRKDRERVGLLTSVNTL